MSRNIWGLLLGGCLWGLVACSTDPDSAERQQKTVRIFGSLTGEGGDVIKAAIAPFTQETGIQVNYEGSDAFATVLPIRVEAGQKPDIAIFSQPGLMANLAQQGELTPLTFLDSAALQAAYDPNWLDLATVDRQLYGIWMRADPKSLVWYSPKAFKAKGYTIPETWAEMEALSKQIIADGGVPWCLGMESGDATGWVGTDWVESILLRTSGPNVYDQWVTHQIPFTASPVKAAFAEFGKIARDPKQVVGGTTGVLSIPFGDSPARLFSTPPGCYLHRQASFITDFLPQEVVLGSDVSVFELPSIKPEWGKPVLMGGLVFSLLNDTPEARAMMDYLITAPPHQILASKNYITPHKGVPLSAYPNPLMQTQATIVTQAKTIRFDGSDLMPASVGTGTFWSGIVDYVNGTDLDRVLNQIDQSWPQPNANAIHQ
jgi:alpha-glucoside transport system substrate-binding protein